MKKTILLFSFLLYSSILVSQENSIEKLLKSINSYNALAFSEDHSMSSDDHFIIKMISHKSFPSSINDIVIEAGNARYQNIVDDYILRNKNIPMSDLKKIWFDTTQLGIGECPFYERLLKLVRKINKDLSSYKKVRILLGDPPINWDLIKSFKDWKKFQNRDGHFAGTTIKNSLSKNRKALLIAGSDHFLNQSNTITKILRGKGYKIHVIKTLNASDLDELEHQQHIIDLRKIKLNSLISLKNHKLGSLNDDILFSGSTEFGEAPKRRVKHDIKYHIDTFIFLGVKSSLDLTPTFPNISDPKLKNTLKKRASKLGMQLIEH